MAGKEYGNGPFAFCLVSRLGILLPLAYKMAIMNHFIFVMYTHISCTAFYDCIQFYLLMSQKNFPIQQKKRKSCVELQR